MRYVLVILFIMAGCLLYQYNSSMKEFKELTDKQIAQYEEDIEAKSLQIRQLASDMHAMTVRAGTVAQATKEAAMLPDIDPRFKKCLGFYVVLFEWIVVGGDQPSLDNPVQLTPNLKGEPI